MKITEYFILSTYLLCNQMRYPIHPLVLFNIKNIKYVYSFLNSKAYKNNLLIWSLEFIGGFYILNIFFYVSIYKKKYLKQNN